MAEIDHLMTQRVQADMNKNRDDIPDEDEEFGFYYPKWYVLDTWVEHEEHGLYPVAGGYDDQDWQLMEDWKTLDRRYNKAWREARAGDPLDAFKGQNGKQADWMQL